MQNSSTLNNAIRMVEYDMKDHLILFNNNTLDKECFSNAGLKLDSNQNCLIVRKKNDNKLKIDGAVNLAILYALYSRHKTEFEARAK